MLSLERTGGYRKGDIIPLAARAGKLGGRPKLRGEIGGESYVVVPARAYLPGWRKKGKQGTHISTGQKPSDIGEVTCEWENQ